MYLYSNISYKFLFFYRLKLSIKELNLKLNEIQIRSKELTNQSVNNIIQSDKLNASQKTIVQEIINASMVTNLKNRRYSENWILLCVLLKIRYVI